ncbi:phage structural protein [uncultured Ilyobacter sp.]|uniref:phage structural protein n=1 Tax=uncultured Ilyobacter sp. TaxID=544433 RepID=UPI0029C62A3F|nr:phage protein [uncultured Ilyobacter sp.]
MSNAYNYDSQNHDIILTIANVPYKVSDYGEDTKITISYEEDFKSTTMGVDGDYTKSKNHNRNALVTLKVLQESPLNAVMAVAAATGEDFYLAHVDRNFSGDVGHFSSDAYFVKIPDLNVGKQAGSREWQVRAHNLKANFVL